MRQKQMLPKRRAWEGRRFPHLAFPVATPPGFRHTLRPFAHKKANPAFIGMKIPLNISAAAQHDKTEQVLAFEHDILDSREGDEEARVRLANHFMRFLTALARERSHDVGLINLYVEAGKTGLYRAARKCKQGGSPERFQMFAVPYIEKSMDRQARRQRRMAARGVHG